MPAKVAPSKKAFLDALAGDMSVEEAKYLLSVLGGGAGGGAAVAAAAAAPTSAPGGSLGGHVAGLAGAPWQAYLKGMEVVERDGGTETSYTPENIWGVGSADPPVQRVPFVPDTLDEKALDLSLNGEHGSIVVGCAFAKGASPRMRILVDMALGEGDAVPPVGGAAGASVACKAGQRVHNMP